MTISQLPADKIRKIVKEGRRLWEKKALSVRDLAVYEGNTMATRQAIQVVPLFHRQLQSLINDIISQLTTKEMWKAYRQVVELSEDAMKEFA